MPNTKSAIKAVRSSGRKQKHNLFWKGKFKASIKSIKSGLADGEDKKILNEKFLILQKTLDKASKEKVIHKNKANRLKSIYAQKISTSVSKVEKPTTKSKAKAQAKK